MINNNSDIDTAQQHATGIAIVGLGAMVIMGTESHWIQAVTLVVVLGTFLYTVAWPIGRYWWLRLRSPFRLYSRDSATGLTRPTMMTIGDSDHVVSVHLSRAMVLDRFDIRFIATKKGGYVDPAIIRITKVQDAETPTTSVNPLVDNDDAKGGRICFWNPPNRKAAGERLRLKLSVHATQTWNGFLSFQGGHPRKARHPVTVNPSATVVSGQEPDHYR